MKKKHKKAAKKEVEAQGNSTSETELKPNQPTANNQDSENPFDFGGLPDRDLKKILDAANSIRTPATQSQG
jgi:hypothetical protein